jgi:hypothetical protein
MDNDVRFVGAVWRALWKLCGTKLKFTSSYNPHLDPAERANRQVLEGLRAAVATVVQYDEWDLALPHITFGLNSHISAATGVSPLEFAHGFSPRVPLTMGLDTAVSEEQPQEAIELAQQVANRHLAAADSMAAGQVRLGRLLQSRSTPAVVKVGDQVWLDSSYVEVAVPYKLTARWFGPFVVLEAKGAQVTLDLPATFGKAHQRVNIRRLKFFEARDAQFGTADQLPRPLPGVVGSDMYEVSRICASRILKGRHELYVEWKGYDQSHISWVLRQILLEDVSALLAAYEAEPAKFKQRASAPIRATKTKVAQKGVAPAAGRVLRGARVFSGGAAIQAQGVASP